MNTSGVKKFFNDLYRDLDDRHLLLPAVALLVAIIAVPFLLGGSAEETAAPVPAPVAVDADATAVQSAVLTSDPGIRDYTQRLEALKEKNPFVQQFSDPAESAGTSLDETAAELSGGATGTTTGESAAATAGVATGEPVPGSGGESPANLAPGSDGTTTDGSTTGGTTDAQTTTNRFYAPRVDVTFGELGDTKQYDNVHHFDFLPKEKNPVAAFLGLGDSADTAVFAISNEVTETSGDGSCMPRDVDGCDLLILKIGEQRMLKVDDGSAYGESTTYRLKVRDTHFSRIPDPRGEDDTPATG
jgi:hypothetical protein